MLHRIPTDDDMSDLNILWVLFINVNQSLIKLIYVGEYGPTFMNILLLLSLVGNYSYEPMKGIFLRCNL